MKPIVYFRYLLFVSLVTWLVSCKQKTSPKPVTLDTFADATIDVVREDGIPEYLPTIVLSAIGEFRVIDGIPAEVDHRVAIQNVIRRSSYDKTAFFFGVRSAPDQITLGHYQAGRPTEFRQILQTNNGYVIKPLASCEWWEIP